MAKYRITGPDGGTYEVTAPDGASEADVLAFAQKNYARPAPQPNPEAPPDPTGSFSENLAAGAGKAVADMGRGLVQRSAEVFNPTRGVPVLSMIGAGMEKLSGVTGVSPSRVEAEARASAAENRRLDAPLMSTGGGIAGNIGGNALLIAPSAGMTGANTLAGAGVVGGMAGALQPTTSGQETITNVGLGIAGGVGGQALANKLPGMLQGRVDAATGRQAGDAQKFAAAREAAKQGYVIPPGDLDPGMASEALSGLSGKIKTAQVASQRNQHVTNRLAAKELGLADGVPINLEALDSVRSEAGKAYGAIANLGKMDVAGAKLPKDVAVQRFTDKLTMAPRSEVDAGEVVRAWKQANHDATGYYRAYARDANPETLAKAKAAANAAKEIDDFLASSLQKMGNSDMLQSLKDARVRIAKTYTVEKALNPMTGDVSAQALAKDLAKGKKLSGGLLSAGQAGQAFPKATQALKEAPKAISPLDYAVATTAGMATGNPLAALMLGARPLARNALLSAPMQARALQQGAPAPFTQATQKALENRLAQLSLAPVGVAGGLQVTQ